jgi:hypothetical protein
MNCRLTTLNRPFVRCRPPTANSGSCHVCECSRLLCVNAYAQIVAWRLGPTDADYRAKQLKVRRDICHATEPESRRPAVLSMCSTGRFVRNAVQYEKISVAPSWYCCSTQNAVLPNCSNCSFIHSRWSLQRPSEFLLLQQTK